MNTYRSILIAAGGLVLTACATAAPPATPAASPSTANGSIGLSSSNPFYAASTLPFQVPPFDKIRNADYQPAIEAGMKQQLAEIDAIANQAAPPTFDNTIIPMERSGALLARAAKTFNAITSANTDSILQGIQQVVAPKLAAHNDAIYLNAKLFQRVKSIYDRRETLGLNAEQKFLVELYQRNFIRAGAQLSEADKTRLRALNQEEATLSTDFSNKLLAATKAGALVLDNAAQLEGLSEGEIATAAEAAKSRGLTGKWVIRLQNTTQHPAQASLKNRDVRQRLFIASTQRASRGDSNDTRGIVQRMAPLRAEKAKLLGYRT